MNKTSNGKTDRIEVRVTPEQKKRIKRNASKCGLTTTEYIRQRALGFEPKTVLPDGFFNFCEKVDELIDKSVSKEFEVEVLALLSQINDELINPRKEDVTRQLQDSGP